MIFKTGYRTGIWDRLENTVILSDQERKGKKKKICQGNPLMCLISSPEHRIFGASYSLLLSINQVFISPKRYERHILYKESGVLSLT